MPIDLTSPAIIDWLTQFEVEHQSTAAALLSAIVTVDADELNFGLTTLLENYAAHSAGPIALYSERQIRRYKGKPNRLFREVGSSSRRAEGDGPVPVPPGRPYARETGSEGLIASLITGLVRANPKRYFDHPGPRVIRKESIRHYIVVTDFIGSGRRACDNLEAAWQIRSFKSWRSFGLLQFAVAAYSGTDEGVRVVKRHRSRPAIVIHTGCPTVHNLPADQRTRIIDLCDWYGPKPSRAESTPLGYANSGALIAFDHCVPNNAPLLLHTKARRWIPLFPQRSAALLRGARRTSARSDEIARALNRLRETRLSAAPRFGGISEDQQARILLLAALKRRPRSPIALSVRTGIPIVEVEELLLGARKGGLIDDRLRLTALAFSTLAYLRRAEVPKPGLPKTNESTYCPKSLRPPRK